MISLKLFIAYHSDSRMTMSKTLSFRKRFQIAVTPKNVSFFVIISTLFKFHFETIELKIHFHTITFIFYFLICCISNFIHTSGPNTCMYNLINNCDVFFLQNVCLGAVNRILPSAKSNCNFFN